MKLRVLIAAALVAAGAVPAAAHHSFGVYFDAGKPVTLTGVVARIDWRNPHTHLYLDVKDDAGRVVTWTLEGFPPGVLARTGWQRDVTVKVGDTLTVFGWRARDGSPAAHMREATLPDGRRMFFGPPAGTGEGAAVAGR